MTETWRFAKAIGYAAATAALLAASVFFCLPMYSETAVVTGYFRSVNYLFVLAFVLIGTAIYAHRAYIRRHREHRADFWLLLVSGVLTLVIALLDFWQFGGLQTTSEGTVWSTAINLNLVWLSVLPLPFLARTLWLALPAALERKGLCRAARIAGLLVAVAYIALAVGRFTLRTVSYDTLTATETADETQQDENWL